MTARCRVKVKRCLKNIRSYHFEVLPSWKFRVSFIKIPTGLKIKELDIELLSTDTNYNNHFLIAGCIQMQPAYFLTL